MKSQRRNITQPLDWWIAFEEQAKAERMTLSEWMGECCASYLVRSKLSERPPAHRPPDPSKSNWEYLSGGHRRKKS